MTRSTANFFSWNQSLNLECDLKNEYYLSCVFSPLVLMLLRSKDGGVRIPPPPPPHPLPNSAYSTQMWQCLDLYASLVCRLHREYFVAFFFFFFFFLRVLVRGEGGGGVAGFCSCCIVFFSFLFVFLFSASFCLVCLFSVVC